MNHTKPHKTLYSIALCAVLAGISALLQFLAQSSLRVQHSVRSSGEAAGIAAVMCVRGNVLPRLLDGASVREVMISKGAEYTE